MLNPILFYLFPQSLKFKKSRQSSPLPALSHRNTQSPAVENLKTITSPFPSAPQTSSPVLAHTPIPPFAPSIDSPKAPTNEPVSHMKESEPMCSTVAAINPASPAKRAKIAQAITHFYHVSKAVSCRTYSRDDQLYHSRAALLFVKTGYIYMFFFLILFIYFFFFVDNNIIIICIGRLLTARSY